MITLQIHQWGHAEIGSISQAPSDTSMMMDGLANKGRIEYLPISQCTCHCERKSEVVMVPNPNNISIHPAELCVGAVCLIIIGFCLGIVAMLASIKEQENKG